MITNKTHTKTAGVLQLPNMDLNFHQYISGSSRSSKTKYICEQAISAVMNGEQVIVIDHSGGFSNDEMGKHIPYELIEKYVSRWEIPKQGLPINLGNLDYCDTLPEKKQRIFGILSAVTQVLGSVQEKVLRKRIGAMLKQTDKLTDISQILDFLEENDDIQKSLRNKLEDVFEEFDDMPKNNNNWSEFLESQKKIVVISTGCDSVSKSTQITDMLIASLYSYKQYVPESKYTVILDECQDLYLDTDGSVDVILRKGGKHGLRMLMASQEFSAERDKLGKIIGNCGTLVFFRPKTDNISDIAKLTGIDKITLTNLEQGQCVVHGTLYNKYEHKNKHVTLIGWTYVHSNQK